MRKLRHHMALPKTKTYRREYYARYVAVHCTGMLVHVFVVA
jgi:hypothetical protein